jgi:hypothetical protein
VSFAEILSELFVVAAVVWFLLAQGSGIVQGLRELKKRRSRSLDY